MSLFFIFSIVAASFCTSFAQPGLYGVKLHSVLNRWDSSLNTVDPNSGLVNNLGEIQLFSKTYYPIQNGLAAQEQGNNSRLYQLFQTSQFEGSSDPMATIHWPNVTVTFSSGAPQSVQYIGYDPALSNTSLFGVAGVFEGNASVVEVNPATGVTSEIVTLDVVVPYVGGTMLAALDSRRHVMYIVGYQNQAAVGQQQLLAVSLPSGRILQQRPIKMATLYVLLCDTTTGELISLATKPDGNAAWLARLNLNGTLDFLGQPLPGNFGTRTIGAINTNATAAYVVGVVGAKDSIFTVDYSTGDLLDITTLNYGDGGNLVSLLYADL